MSKKPQPPPADRPFDPNRPTSPPPPKVPFSTQLIHEARQTLRGLRPEQVWVDKEILIHVLRVAEAAKGMAKGVVDMTGETDTFQANTLRKSATDEVIAADKAIAQLRNALGYTPVE